MRNLAGSLTSMNHVVVMEIVDGFEDLFDCLGSIFLSELAVFANSIEELAPCCQLGDDIIFVLQNVKTSVLPCFPQVWTFSLTLDSNQSWKRTMLGCFILCNKTISSYTIFSFPFTFFFRMILMAYLSPPHSASLTMPYVPAPSVRPNRY